MKYPIWIISFLLLLAGCGPGGLTAVPAIEEDLQTAITMGKALSSAMLPQPRLDTSPAGTVFAGKVDIGGYALYLQCLGQGKPTVVMDAGLADTSATWGLLPTQIAEMTRVCIYDRAGLGQSDPGPEPRTSQQIVAELHTLLGRARVEGPYLLVGHSFGGYNVRLYTSQYPDQVVGVVLVDAAHEEQLPRMYEILSPGTAETALPYPQNAEGVDLRISGAQLRKTGSLGHIPLVVICHGRQMLTYDLDFPGQMEQLWLDLQRDLAGLSSNSRFIVAKKSGHTIQADQPDLVLEVIYQMVSALRQEQAF